MKTKMSVLMISISLVAGIAQAASLDMQTSKTRAQVIVELHEARALGLLSDGELDYPVEQQTSNSKTRQDVRAELAAARAAGTLSEGELDYPPVVLDHNSKTRQEVQAEFDTARQSGELSRFIEH